jgi:hypothetical protein
MTSHHNHNSSNVRKKAAAFSVGMGAEGKCVGAVCVEQQPKEYQEEWLCTLWIYAARKKERGRGTLLVARERNRKRERENEGTKKALEIHQKTKGN